MRKFTNTNGNEDTRNTLSAYLRLSIVNENKFHVPIRYFYGCFEHIFFCLLVLYLADDHAAAANCDGKRFFFCFIVLENLKTSSDFVKELNKFVWKGGQNWYPPLPPLLVFTKDLLNLET